MLLDATLWLTVTHTFLVIEPTLANWSKRFDIAFRSYFCSLLTSDWGVSTGRFLYSFKSFSQITQKLVISSYVEEMETNLPVGKHTLRGFTCYFRAIVGKSLFRCFIYVFVSICCILCHFYRFMLLNALLWLTVTKTFNCNGPNLAEWTEYTCIAY